MEQSLMLFITALCSIAASSGFWAFIMKQSEKKDAKTRMILGLGHDRLLYLCMIFIDRGSITQDELENLHEYLYKPYLELGGNGTVKRLMQEVDCLPVVRNVYKKEGS